MRIRKTIHVVPQKVPCVIKNKSAKHIWTGLFANLKRLKGNLPNLAISSQMTMKLPGDMLLVKIFSY